MTNELLQLLPNHERANGNKKFYEKEIAHLKQLRKMKGDDGTDEMPVSDLVSFPTTVPTLPPTYSLFLLPSSSPWPAAIRVSLI